METLWGGEVVLTSSLRQVYAEPFKCQSYSEEGEEGVFLFLFSPQNNRITMITISFCHPTTHPLLFQRQLGCFHFLQESCVLASRGPHLFRRKRGDVVLASTCLLMPGKAQAGVAIKQGGGQLHIPLAFPFDSSDPKSPTLPTPVEV